MFRKKQTISELKEGDAVEDVFVVKIKKGITPYAKGFSFTLLLTDNSGKTIEYKYWGGQKEEELRKADAVISKNELKRRLPVKIMHQTLSLILEYLESSGKIMIGSKGISWLQRENESLRAMLKRAVRVA